MRNTHNIYPPPSKEERAAILATIDRYAPPWFAVRWGENGIEAKTVDAPRWERIPHGPCLLQGLHRVARPHRYTMRRKLRRIVR